MTDAPLLQPDERAPQRGPTLSRRAFVVAAIVAILALLVAAAVWWYLNGRQTIPDWERLPVVDLSAPAGDAVAADTPWVRLQLAADDAAGANPLRVSIDTRHGTPVPAGATPPAILAFTAAPLAVDAAAGAGTLEIDADEATLSVRFDRTGWWRLSVDVAGTEQPAQFHLLSPDPNLEGPNAVPNASSSPAGEAVFQRGIAAITALRSVRFTQWIADGKGNAAVAEHAVTAGEDGSPPAFTFRVQGGMEAVIIGETRWTRQQGQTDWQRQEGAMVVLPADWGDEYSGATGFTLLGEETIDGERCQLVAFVVPELTEPRRRTVAWYLWWVGAESGHVRQEAMVSRLHYMRNIFTGFDEPIVITAPETPGTPVAGTPAG